MRCEEVRLEVERRKAETKQEQKLHIACAVALE